MNDSDKKQFYIALGGVCELYEKEITKSLAQIYFAALKQYSVEDVTAAFAKHTNDSEQGMFMPKPAHIVKQIDGTQKQNDDALKGRAEMAHSILLNAVKNTGASRTPKFKDPLITAAIISMGGWPAICAYSQEDLNNWKRKEFIDNYLNYAKTPTEFLPSHIAGIEDLDKAKKESAQALKTITTNLEKLRLK